MKINNISPYIFCENFGVLESGGTNAPFLIQRFMAAATYVSGDEATA
jgi:hypothetical protein